MARFNILRFVVPLDRDARLRDEAVRKSAVELGLHRAVQVNPRTMSKSSPNKQKTSGSTQTNTSADSPDETQAVTHVLRQLAQSYDCAGAVLDCIDGPKPLTDLNHLVTSLHLAQGDLVLEIDHDRFSEFVFATEPGYEAQFVAAVREHVERQTDTWDPITLDADELTRHIEGNGWALRPAATVDDLPSQASTEGI